MSNLRADSVHANQMGDFVGEHKPTRNRLEMCPECGGVKSRRAQTCIGCSPRKQVQRSAEAMDNHHRFEAAIQAGWHEWYLIRARPDIPTWEEIVGRCPEAVIKWHPELVIGKWWEAETAEPQNGA